jgi:hypothetical protein
MKTLMLPLSIMFPRTTISALRRHAACETLKTGRNITTSAVVRQVVEEYLGARRDERAATTAAAAQ